SSQQRLLAAVAETFGLPQPPRRIEIYDNSHIQGSNAVGAMVVAGPEGFRKNQYRKFNIRTAQLTPGDDYGMMREVLTRRFKRLAGEMAPGDAPPPGVLQVAESPLLDVLPAALSSAPRAGDDDEALWPDLVVIDGGPGQLTAARETLAALGL